MKSTSVFLTAKLLQSRRKQSVSQGFTFIELLVVVIFIAVLTVIALPNYLGQVGKSKETSAKNTLGVIARAQQAYRFEKKVFAPNFDTLLLQGTFDSKYYSFTTYSPPSDNYETVVKHKAIAINSFEDGVREYAIGIYYNDGDFENFLCQGKGIGISVDVPDYSSFAQDCLNDGTRIK